MDKIKYKARWNEKDFVKVPKNFSSTKNMQRMPKKNKTCISGIGPGNA